VQKGLHRYEYKVRPSPDLENAGSSSSSSSSSGGGGGGGSSSSNHHLNFSKYIKQDVKTHKGWRKSLQHGLSAVKYRMMKSTPYDANISSSGKQIPATLWKPRSTALASKQGPPCISAVALLHNARRVSARQLASSLRVFTQIT
jgi:hypothetical protein